MGCGECPLSCRELKKGRGKLREFAELWSLPPDFSGLADLVSSFIRRCDDAGADAFEAAGAIALFLEAGRGGPGSPSDVAALAEEIGRRSERGRLICSGIEAAAEALGVSPKAGGKPGKKLPASPEEAAFLDALGACPSAGLSPSSPPEVLSSLAELLSSARGRVFEPEELRSMGRRILETEEKWNEAARRGTSGGDP
jgi:aldehyde:ferredoxin oxidoreductase